MLNKYYRILMKAMGSEFKIGATAYFKVAAIIVGLILLFVIAASAASPVFAAWDTRTGYGIGEGV